MLILFKLPGNKTTSLGLTHVFVGGKFLDSIMRGCNTSRRMFPYRLELIRFPFLILL